MPPGDSPSKRLVYPNHLLRASTRTPTARTRRAIALRTSLTFRAVTLPLRTCVRWPFGLDTALTSFLTSPSPARTHGRSGRRCQREAGLIMAACTDILSLALAITRIRKRCLSQPDRVQALLDTSPRPASSRTFSSGLSWAEPRGSTIRRTPPDLDTICTAVASEAVLTLHTNGLTPANYKGF